MVYEHELDMTQQAGRLKAEDWFGKSTYANIESDTTSRKPIKRPAVFSMKRRQHKPASPDIENGFIKIRPDDIEVRRSMLSRFIDIVLKCI
jgi:hypothetical protein